MARRPIARVGGARGGAAAGWRGGGGYNGGELWGNIRLVKSEVKAFHSSTYN